MQCTQTVPSFRMKVLDASVSSVYRMDVKEVIMPNSRGDQLFNWAVGIYAIAKRRISSLWPWGLIKSRYSGTGIKIWESSASPGKLLLYGENASYIQRLDRLMLRSGRFPALNRGAIESKS